MQTFSSDSFILNYVQSLPIIVSENEEEFDFAISNVAAGDLMSVFSHEFSDIIFCEYLDVL